MASSTTPDTSISGELEKTPDLQVEGTAVTEPTETAVLVNLDNSPTLTAKSTRFWLVFVSLCLTAFIHCEPQCHHSLDSHSAYCPRPPRRRRVHLDQCIIRHRRRHHPAAVWTSLEHLWPTLPHANGIGSLHSWKWNMRWCKQRGHADRWAYRSRVRRRWSDDAPRDHSL